MKQSMKILHEVAKEFDAEVFEVLANIGGPDHPNDGWRSSIMYRGHKFSAAEGLCINLYKMYAMNGGTSVSDYNKIMDRLPRGWEHFSGSPAYPVPPRKGQKKQEGIEAFHIGGKLYSETPNKYVGQYGDLRRDLLRYIIAETAQ